MPVYGVVLISQLVGMAIAVALTVIRAESVPSAADVGWSIAGGILGAVGITFLYRALAVGRMGVVAPITAILAAIIPVGFGILFEGLPAPMVLAGIALALVAVLLVTRVADGGDGGGRDGIDLAIVSGTAIGLFGIVIAQFSEGQVFGPLSIVRVTEAIVIVVAILATRSAWRPPGRVVPAIVGIGVADMTGNAAYIAAVQTGALAVASVVSALYPVMTVVLAAVFLHERISRSHAAGIALAALAIVLIGLGST